MELEFLTHVDIYDSPENINQSSLLEPRLSRDDGNKVEPCVVPRKLLLLLVDAPEEAVDSEVGKGVRDVRNALIPLGYVKKSIHRVVVYRPAG